MPCSLQYHQSKLAMPDKLVERHSYKAKDGDVGRNDFFGHTYLTQTCIRSVRVRMHNLRPCDNVETPLPLNLREAVSKVKWGNSDTNFNLSGLLPPTNGQHPR